MNLPPRRFYEFASFRVDVAERRLWRDGDLVSLTPKVFDILLVLLENAGRTVEKERLFEEVWSDTIVEEGNLNRNISTLRKALGDDGQRQELIRTIPKRGYRFTSEVAEHTLKAEEVLMEESSAFRMRLTEEVEEGWSFDSKVKKTAIAGVILLSLAAGVAFLAWYQRMPSSSAESAITDADRKEARQLYERGRALWRTRDGSDLHQATNLLERSTAKDPEFANAWAALADAYAFDSRLWMKAEETARKAIELDPTLAGPHASIGLVKLMWEWDLQTAEQEFKEAIKLDPDNATVRQWYSLNLHAFGHSGHAAHLEMRKALELEPRSVSINADMCQTLYFVRRYEDAVIQCLRTLEMDPGSYNAHLYLYEIYSTAGDSEKAYRMYLKMDDLALSPLPADVKDKLRDGYSSEGIDGFRRALITYLANSWPNHYRIAREYAWLKDNDKAFDHLRLAFQEKSFGFHLFLADPAFFDLRGDPRYKEIKELLLPAEGSQRSGLRREQITSEQLIPGVQVSAFRGFYIRPLRWSSHMPATRLQRCE